MTTINLQDELAGLNHRLDHKLDAWRILHRRHRLIALRLAYAFILLILSLYFRVITGLQLIPSGTIWVLSAAIIIPFFYCLRRRSHYWYLLDRGYSLRDSLYSSYLGNEASNDSPNGHNSIKEYHNKLSNLIKEESKALWWLL